ncbi:putative bifunctional diguanylate cyclase/phosphodiesterase [Lentibacillus saliphilus]|uniref:putative bifunctional diguanylate cyclase/phosphodiesterase n=1 Tax=Lentibacillus saliphilus TaxID=2737028 RepID=UPI001C301121|nr:EAL domain-containing protein [Lentibacillus saliphilus]
MKKRHAIIMIVVYVAAFYSWLFLIGNNDSVEAFGTRMFSLAGGLVSFIWIRKAAQGMVDQKGRRFWFLLTLGVLSYSMSHLFLLNYQVLFQVEINLNIAHILGVLAYVIFLTALMYLSYHLQRNKLRSRFYFNVLIFMTFAISVSAHFLIKPTFDLIHESFIVIVLSRAYPIIDLAIIFVMLHIYYLYSRLKQKWLLIMMVGFGIQVIGDTSYIYMLSEGIDHIDSLLAPFWSVALLLIGLAGRYAKEEGSTLQWRIEHFIGEEDSVIPYAAVLVLVVLFVSYSNVSSNPLAIGLGLTLLFITVRQLVVIRQTNSLMKKYRYLAHHDPLTSLKNRSRLQTDLKEYIQKARHLNASVGIFLLDLDGFKQINDTLGHHVGDLLLNKAAERLKQSIGPDDRIYRIGGDEFMMILPNRTEEGCLNIAEHITEQFSVPLSIEDYDIIITPSIGMSLFPEHGRTSDVLLKCADISMYDAKKSPDKHYQLYNEVLNNMLVRRLKIESGLRHAIANDELSLLYQPKVILATRDVVGVEALLRWEHPEYGVISPAEFIPAAEESGQINMIGGWALEEACKQLKIWHDRGFSNVLMSVNVSVKQFQHNRFIPSLKQILHRTGVNPAYLELEITESIMQNTAQTTRVLKDLHAMGIKAAIDDFGTGYSSLHVLKSLPIDTIKIDKAFIDDPSDVKQQALVRTIIDIGLNLDLNVVVEGIEAEAQLDPLLNMPSVLGQGYLFGKPMSKEEIIPLFDKL